MKQQKKLWVMAAILFIICGASAFTSCSNNDDNPVDRALEESRMTI